MLRSRGHRQVLLLLSTGCADADLGSFGKGGTPACDTSGECYGVEAEEDGDYDLGGSGSAGTKRFPVEIVGTPGNCSGTGSVIAGSYGISDFRVLGLIETTESESVPDDISEAPDIGGVVDEEAFEVVKSTTCSEVEWAIADVSGSDEVSWSASHGACVGTACVLENCANAAWEGSECYTSSCGGGYALYIREPDADRACELFNPMAYEVDLVDHADIGDDLVAVVDRLADLTELGMLEAGARRGPSCVRGEGLFALLPVRILDRDHDGLTTTTFLPLSLQGTGQLTKDARISRVAPVHLPEGAELWAVRVGSTIAYGREDRLLHREQVALQVDGTSNLEDQDLRGYTPFVLERSGVNPSMGYEVRMQWTCDPLATQVLPGEAAYGLSLHEIGCGMDQRITLRPSQSEGYLSLEPEGAPPLGLRIPLRESAGGQSFALELENISVEGALLRQTDTQLTVRLDRVRLGMEDVCRTGVFEISAYPK